ncbi:jg21270 [Pararge aegeria aegeria]|uniref:Jg21270 protein n=1 Tax=Pararge aegeria aegeria TaxID=348720 RepID=A0A8S4R456_9NEOP|nr:jg21270 [Pararge aegeria aegeria]
MRFNTTFFTWRKSSKKPNLREDQVMWDFYPLKLSCGHPRHIFGRLRDLLTTHQGLPSTVQRARPGSKYSPDLMGYWPRQAAVDPGSCKFLSCPFSGTIDQTELADDYHPVSVVSEQDRLPLDRARQPPF